MNVLLRVFVYFAAGIGSDLLTTLWSYSVSRSWAVSASLVSIPIALVSFWVLRFLDPTPIDALSYAVGNAVGCFLIIEGTKWISARRSAKNGKTYTPVGRSTQTPGQP